ncbi:calcium/sodium antiporter [bacterium]|nr:calcium/sodium antiporter [bacterium]
MMTLTLLVVGLLVLTLGAELLVKGSSRLAAAVGISPLVIGLTIVAYGTSTPELVVSISSGLRGQDDVAIANIVGSNIFNVLAILGLCAVILPLHVSSQLIRIDVPIMIASSFLCWFVSYDGRVGKVDGAILTALIVIYTVWSILKSRKETKEVAAEYEAEYGEAKSGGRSSKAILLDLFFIAAGIGCLIIGGRWFVDGSIELARYLEVSELIIGLTIVAAGTSMPELATSIVATIRGERDIAIGNVVGSNIYNILCILGIASLVTPNGLAVNPLMMRVDIPVMTLVAIACFPIFFTGLKISRWEGLLFLMGYIAYTGYLIWSAQVQAIATPPVAIPSGPPQAFMLPFSPINLLV